MTWSEHAWKSLLTFKISKYPIWILRSVQQLKDPVARRRLLTGEYLHHTIRFSPLEQRRKLELVFVVYNDSLCFVDNYSNHQASLLSLGIFL